MALGDTDPRNVAAKLVLEAVDAVFGPRNDDYGPPFEDMKKLAGMWSALLGIEVEPYQAGLMMGCVKTCREWHKPKHDNAVDAIGWTLVEQDCLHHLGE